MKCNMRIKFWGSVTVMALIMGWSANAQTEEPIADQDLLNLLQTVNQDVAANAVDDVADLSAEPAVEPEETEIAETEMTAVDPVETNEAPAAVNEEPETATEDVVIDDLAMAELEGDAGSNKENLISVRLNKVGLEEAISLFAQLSGANIIVPDLAETAQISVNLKDVEWRPALQSILDTYDYELYQKVVGSNVYSVRRRPEGSPDPQVVETFVLKYATVPNAAALIRDLLPESAKVSEFASRNMIVVKSSESSLSEIRAVLETVDKVRQQVYIESKFMELSDGNQLDLGIDWETIASYSMGTKPQYSYGRENGNNAFTDINGNRYQAADGTFSETLPTTTAPVLKDLIPTKYSTSANVLTSVLNADQFNLVMSALEESKGVNVVSNPKLIVANEELANISIVRKEPNLKQERQQTGSGDAPIDQTVFSLDTEMPFFEYGIKLNVTPSINTSSNITVKIEPSLTRFFDNKAAGQTSYPIIDEKSIKTVFNLADGQTAAIGGLSEVTDSEIERKVPILGSVPMLGRLFSWKQNVKGQEETIIFVTVGLANTQNIREDIGMPADAELARRRVIRDRNNQQKREMDRSYFKAQESEKLEDLLLLMEQSEQNRLEKRTKSLEKEGRLVAAAEQEVAPQGESLEEILNRIE
ncbi:MAG TPA: hypothetical protein VIR63_00305 [Pontiella sp.]